jgi:hypothetical protein
VARLTRSRVAITLLVLAAACAACSSPEASRTRGAGHGADVGNRGSVVVIHDGANPYWHTPQVGVAGRR